MVFRQEIQESLTLKFAESANERRKQGLNIISLGLGEPEFDVPKEIIQATQRILGSRKAGYSSPMGLPVLREKLAVKLNSENNINCTANNIIITPGSKQALQLVLMALLRPDDEVIVLAPSFVSFIPQIFIAEPNCVVHQVDVLKEDFSLPIKQIGNLTSKKTKLLLINSPNNPAGYVFTKRELKELYALAEENDFYIISDEIYEKLIFNGIEHFSIGSLENKVKRVITINGFSKSYAMTGWRVGYACFPEELSSNLLKLQQHINTNTCTFIQEALAETIDIIDYSYLDEYNIKLAERVTRYNLMIKSTPGLSSVIPNGGFFGFFNISELKIDSNTFCSKLILETGVATTPGVAFGNVWDDHVRISFATKDEILDEGLNLISNFVKNL